MAMGKSKAFQGKEAFQRMNFLFQASGFLMSHLNQPRLAAYYGNQVVSICQKSVLRMEPRVKRQLCKGCRAPLIPGVSSRFRVKSQTKTLNIACTQCGTLKRFPLKPGYKLWVETPEACVQTFGTKCVEHSEGKPTVQEKAGLPKKQNEDRSHLKVEKEFSTQESKCTKETRTNKNVAEDQETNKSQLKKTTESNLTDVISATKED